MGFLFLFFCLQIVLSAFYFYVSSYNTFNNTQTIINSDTDWRHSTISLQQQNMCFHFIRFESGWKCFDKLSHALSPTPPHTPHPKNHMLDHQPTTSSRSFEDPSSTHSFAQLFLMLPVSSPHTPKKWCVEFTQFYIVRWLHKLISSECLNPFGDSGHYTGQRIILSDYRVIMIGAWKGDLVQSFHWGSCY